MKQALEFFPLIVFFVAYQLTDIITATIILTITSFISFGTILFYSKKIVYMPLISALLVGVFGFLTWYLDNPIFIKIKPTILNILFGLILITAYFCKKPLMKFILEQAFKMDDHNWLVLTLRWGLFFLFLALINEKVWRNFSENFWVNFKVFGMLPITITFTLAQMPYMMRHQIK